MKQPNVILATLAAGEKGCSRQAICNAIDRGDLTGVRMGRQRMVLLDKKYREYQVKTTGGRLHRSYLTRNQGE